MADGPLLRLRGDLDTPRPLRAVNGKIVLTGWCLVPGSAEPPAVRLAAAGRTLTADTEARTDVAALFPGEPAAARCGFRLHGLLPTGVHVARLEARLPG